MNNDVEYDLNKYKRRGFLSRVKLKEYLPAMIMSNTTSLLLSTVDGLVVGNLVGAAALSAVAVFLPVLQVVGVLTDLTMGGISTSLSTALGSNESKKINEVRGASFYLMIYMAILVSVIQIPIIVLLVSPYRSSPVLYRMIWQYAIGLMFSAPLGLLSATGACLLQIEGRMKTLLKLAVMEGVVNLVLDLLFVGPMHMGVAGAGYGTACANVIRCSITFIYIYRRTDMLSHSGYKQKISDYLEILRCGFPDASTSLVNSLKNYFMTRILYGEFGDAAGAIHGVCMFCFSLTNVLTRGILDSMRPITGLYSGAGDEEGLRHLMRQGKKLCLIMIGASIAIVELFPGFFFTIHGVKTIPQVGITAVRFYAPFFIVYAMNGLYMLFLVNKKDSKYTTISNTVGNLTQPVFALILSRIFSLPWIYLSYSMAGILVQILFRTRYRWWQAKAREKDDNRDGHVLYMSVRPEEAVDASREIREFANAIGINSKVSYRIALCMEEMVAYAVSVNEEKVVIQIIVRFLDKDEAAFVIMDNGKCIALEKEEAQSSGELTTDNYVLMQRLAKSVEYEYVLNMNYTILTFSV